MSIQTDFQGNKRTPTMRRTSKSIKPTLTRETQESIWRFADALARGLREPSDGDQGDSRWTVSGLANSVWEINHPDFESLSLPESPLRIRIKQTTPGKWAVFTQNNLKNLQNTNTVHITDQPIKSWNFEELAKAASVYFKEQKKKIDALKEELQPSLEPGATLTAPPQNQGGMPMASKKRQALLQKRKLSGKRTAEKEESNIKKFGSSAEALSERNRIQRSYPSLTLEVLHIPQWNKYIIAVANKAAKKKSNRIRVAANLENLQKAEKVAAFLRKLYANKSWLKGVSVINDRDGIGVEIRTATLIKNLPVRAATMPIQASTVSTYIAEVPQRQLRRAIIDLQGVGVEKINIKNTSTPEVKAIYFEATEDEFDRIHEMGAYHVKIAD